MQPLLITGIPRSGTTLAAALIDGAPDSYCLSEPDEQVGLMLASENAEVFVDRLAALLEAVRQTLLAGGKVADRRAVDGRPLTNYFADPGPDGQRETTYTLRLAGREGLPPDFLLASKHNALYVAVLPQLVRSGRFRILALVRDPVDALMSWRSLALPISSGRLPAAERFWEDMRELTLSALDLTEKQILICDLFCRRFAAWRHALSMLRYESLVSQPEVLFSAAGLAKVPLASGLITTPRIDSADAACVRQSLAEQVRRLAVQGRLPGICHFYPAYGNLDGRENSRS